MLEGKVVAVTGAGRGIGRACAEGLARLGASVVVNDIDGEQASETAAAIRDEGGRAVASHGTIADWAGAAALIEQTQDAFGSIDGLVNNAGLFRVASVEEMAEAYLDAMIRVNIVGTIACAVHAIRAMRKAGTRGSIVNITSGAQAGQPALSAYGATKGAVASFTYGCAVDLHGTGIRVNAVSPLGETRMRGVMDAFRAALGTGAPSFVRPSPANNVPVIAYLLSDRAADIAGQVVRIDGARMSIMSHPAICLPYGEADEWTPECVAAAFDTTLRALRQPLGVRELAMTPVARG